VSTIRGRTSPARVPIPWCSAIMNGLATAAARSPGSVERRFIHREKEGFLVSL